MLVCHGILYHHSIIRSLFLYNLILIYSTIFWRKNYLFFSKAGGENLKSIKEHRDNKCDATLQSILGQSLWYSRCCILSVSLMSGFGLPWNYDDARVSSWFGILEGIHDNCTTPENITILRAVYKKGSPLYSNTYNGNMKDYRNFIWDDSSYKRIITPTAQAYLIMDEVMLAQYFYKCMDESFRALEGTSEKLAISLLLMNSAIIQAEFMSNYLRNSDGLFVSKTDTSENSYGEPNLDEIDGIPTVSEQALALKTYSMLSGLLDDPGYPQFKDHKSSLSFKRYADEIYEVFLDSPQDIFESKTRDLCNVISSCIQYYTIGENKTSILEHITKLSLELESRVDMSGNVLRFPFENKLASSTSCFATLKALIEAYRATGIYKFLSTSTTLYKKLNLMWDPVSNLYMLDNDSKYKYTSRDVGSIISGLNSIRLFGDDQYKNDAGNKLVSFFNSAVNSSKLVQSSMPLPSISDYEGAFNCARSSFDSISYGNFCHVDIPQTLETGIAPVFAKKFTFKPQKHTFDINSGAFYTEYALYLANEMLEMNYPQIDCYSLSETLSIKDGVAAESCEKEPPSNTEGDALL